jgi:hypothetical protein
MIPSRPFSPGRSASTERIVIFWRIVIVALASPSFSGFRHHVGTTGNEINGGGRQRCETLSY